MNIFGSLPVSVILHEFVGIRAKSWGLYLKHQFRKTVDEVMIDRRLNL